MKPSIVCLILMCAIALSGCIVTVDSDGGHPYPHPHDDTTLAEIDAVSHLSFESGKLNGYQDIASRPQLSADAQVYLVQRSLENLSFETSKQSVVMTLIENPGFVAEAKRAILENLDAFSFESSKQSILSALNKRGPVPSGMVEIPIETTTTVEVEVGYGSDL